MRRQEKSLSSSEAEDILKKGEYGVLSLCGDDSVPYGVPLSYVYHNNALYFHCACEGYKLMLMDTHPKVSFCVVGDTVLRPEKFTTEYESAILCGTVQRVEGEEKESALLALIGKYAPDNVKDGTAYIERAAHKTCVIKIVIASLTGKASPARK